MNVNQILKWRKGILAGKNKYYPKELSEATKRIGMKAEDLLKNHYEKRSADYLKNNTTKFRR